MYVFYFRKKLIIVFVLYRVRNKVPHTTGRVTLPDRLQEMKKTYIKCMQHLFLEFLFVISITQLFIYKLPPFSTQRTLNFMMPVFVIKFIFKSHALQCLVLMLIFNYVFTFYYYCLFIV